MRQVALIFQISIIVCFHLYLYATTRITYRIQIYQFVKICWQAKRTGIALSRYAALNLAGHLTKWLWAHSSNHVNNSSCCYYKIIKSTRSQFLTYSHKWASVRCAKLWPGHYGKFRAKCSYMLPKEISFTVCEMRPWTNPDPHHVTPIACEGELVHPQ